MAAFTARCEILSKRIAEISAELMAKAWSDDARIAALKSRIDKSVAKLDLLKNDNRH